MNSRDASLFAEAQIDQTTDLTRDLAASDSQMYSGLRLDWIAAVREIIHSEEGPQSSVGGGTKNKSIIAGTFIG